MSKAKCRQLPIAAGDDLGDIVVPGHQAQDHGPGQANEDEPTVLCGRYAWSGYAAWLRLELS